MKDLAYLLEKETIEIPENEGTSELEQDLATQAAEVLGYTKLQTAVQNKTHALARVIKNLGIETLKKESVNTYQAAVIEEKRQEVIVAARAAQPKYLRNHFKFLDNHVHQFGHISLAIALVSGLVCIQSAITGEISLQTTLILFSVFGISLSMIFVCFMKEISYPTYIWHRISLDKHYTQEVREFALDRAITIKKVLPSAQIFVEECAEVKDPFLVAVNGEEEYYFAVYDEPKFESNL